MYLLEFPLQGVYLFIIQLDLMSLFHKFQNIIEKYNIKIAKKHYLTALFIIALFFSF